MSANHLEVLKLLTMNMLLVFWLVCLSFFGFRDTPAVFQELRLALFPEINPGNAWGTICITRNRIQVAVCKVSDLPIALARANHGRF